MNNIIYDYCIIGAGYNGLLLANYLAHAGYKTLLLERNFKVGGYYNHYKCHS